MGVRTTMFDIKQALQEIAKNHGQAMNSCGGQTQYKCEKCRDTGMVEVDPKTRTFAKCECRIARESEERLERSGLAGAIQRQTLESFVTNTPTQRRMKETAQRYIADVIASNGQPRRPWLYIGGNPGSGKTHICTAVCGELLKRNIGVRYMQWLNEVRRLKASVNDEDFEDLVAPYINIPVLYIDDLMKQKYTQNPVFTEADVKIAFTILNARYIQNKPTIISTEWDLLNHLLPADEGVFSRVYERCKGYTVNIERSPQNNFRLSA